MRMQKAAKDNIAAGPGGGSDAYQSIVLDLMSLIGQVHANLLRIENAIARETSLAPGEAVDAGVIVLDDVTPRYAKAGEVLKACVADLGVALEFLLEAKATGHRPH
jgi:hypothetical protein